MAGLSELRAPSPFLPLSQRQPSKLSTPEYTVELKGASLTWAPKDKSSKKNVLEVSCGGGEKKGLTGGLGPKLGKPQEEDLGRVGAGILRAQSQSCPHRRDLSTVFLVSWILQFPLLEHSSPILGPGGW